RPDLHALELYRRSHAQPVDGAVKVENEVARLDKKPARAEDQNRCDEQTERAEHEGADEGRADFFLHCLLTASQESPDLRIVRAGEKLAGIAARGDRPGFGVEKNAVRSDREDA